MSAPVRVASFAELSGAEVYGLLQLRAAVFVVEQGCVFLDPDDRDTHPQTRHALVGPDPLRPLATARLLPTGMSDGPASEAQGRSIGRVVTASAARGEGLAGRLLDAFVEEAGEGLLTLNAQARLEGYYARWGFLRSGEDFLEDDILHVPMRREPTRR